MADESEEERIRRAIVEAVVENYDTIARAQEANRRVEVVSGRAQAESDKLRESLIKLQAQSKSVMQAGTVWRRKKQILGSAVAQQQKLLAFAEAPALVEECIRGEMYHEAVLVVEHVLRGHQHAGRGVSLGVRTEQQLREALARGLEEVVLPRLSGPLSLDASFKTVTFMRRLGASTERLRELFLESRSRYILRLADEANSGSVAYSRMLKHVNIYRLHVSEVIMHYCACFPANPSATTGGGVGGGDGRDGVEEWDVGLRRWCHAQAERFVATFAATIKEIANGSELALVEEQCSSCSVNLAKLHADVAPLLHELIAERVKAIFADHMAHALNAYAASMKTFSWRLPPSYSSGGGGGGGDAQATEADAPPLVLTHWLPLAYALNGLLTAFNAVRKCLVPGVEVFCGDHVEALLGRIVSDLLRDGELAGTMEEAERGVYGDFVAVFVNVFYPYVMRCTRKLLGVEVTRWLEEDLADSFNMLSRQLLPAAAGVADSSSHPPLAAAPEPPAHQLPQAQQPTGSPPVVAPAQETVQANPVPVPPPPPAAQAVPPVRNPFASGSGGGGAVV